MSDRELAVVRATRIGFVFQQFFLAEHSTALENVADGLLYAGVAVAERRAPRPTRSPASGSATGSRRDRPSSPAASGSASRSRGRSSGGRRSCSRTSRPATSTAPPAAILALLEELNADGATIVVITHDHDLAARLPRQIEMLDGRIVSDGAHKERG